MMTKKEIFMRVMSVVISAAFAVGFGMEIWMRYFQ